MKITKLNGTESPPVWKIRLGIEPCDKQQVKQAIGIHEIK
jgi:hypothetical protein